MAGERVSVQLDSDVETLYKLELICRDIPAAVSKQSPSTLKTANILPNIRKIQSTTLHLNDVLGVGGLQRLDILQKRLAKWSKAVT